MAKKVSTCCQSNLIPTTLHPTTKASESLSVESDSESDDSKGNSNTESPLRMPRKPRNQERQRKTKIYVGPYQTDPRRNRRRNQQPVEEASGRCQ
ncbi:hypothetical protein OS493_019252 [Desmophyllum pertusum]|uniref:Uncharacterized protein n=1 Tax=Desmophyllum pertusum TaxID=174260 RepID=A0A9X0CE43_9CNID|nr:hypothetical protein OS493_019252 [Desmophyllum pertusum]